MRRYLMLSLIGLACLVSSVSAQIDTDMPLITDENMANLALAYVGQATDFYLLQTRPILLQEFVPPELETNWRDLESRRVSVIDLETGSPGKTLDTSLGLISNDERYMLSESRTGFTIWDLQLYQAVFTLTVEAPLVRQFGKTYGVQNYPQDPVPPLGVYTLFVVEGSQAVVGSGILFHIIDLETGQETDRYFNRCASPEWLITLIQGVCDRYNVSLESPLQTDPYFSLSGELTYPANNLKLILSSGGLVTLDTNTPIDLPTAQLPYPRSVQLGAAGRLIGIHQPYEYGEQALNLLVLGAFACRANGSDSANVRVSASVTSDLIGPMKKLYGSDAVGVVAQSQQKDGTWWQLATGGWVRDDVLQKEGGCSDLSNIP